MLSYEQLREIIHDVANGKHVKVALQERGVPKYVYSEALQKYPDLQATKMLAEHLNAEIAVYDAVEISDTESDPFRAKNRIDARKYLASRLHPARFGDRLDVNVTTVSITAALDEARTRALRSMGDQGRITDAQVIETKAITGSTATDSKSAVESSPAENNSKKPVNPLE